MDIKKINESVLGRMNPRIATWLYNRIKNLPAVRQAVDKEYERLIDDLEPVLKPYRGQFETCADIPETGRNKSNRPNGRTDLLPGRCTMVMMSTSTF